MLEVGGAVLEEEVEMELRGLGLELLEKKLDREGRTEMLAWADADCRAEVLAKALELGLGLGLELALALAEREDTEDSDAYADTDADAEPLLL
jgi:hypothetical protein